MNVIESLRTDWLEENNSKQCRWAFRYLGLDQGLYALVEPTSHYMEVLTHLKGWKDTLENRTKARAIRDAWRQKKYRDARTEMKPYSFFLANEVGPKLKRLSKESGLHQNQVIEKLILDAHKWEQDRQQAAKKERQERLKAAEEKARRPQTETVSKKSVKDLETKLRLTELKLDALLRFDDDQLTALAECLAKLEARNLAKAAPSKDEDRLAYKILEELQQKRTELMK